MFCHQFGRIYRLFRSHSILRICFQHDSSATHGNAPPSTGCLLQSLSLTSGSGSSQTPTPGIVLGEPTTKSSISAGQMNRVGMSEDLAYLTFCSFVVFPFILGFLCLFNS